MNIGQNLFLTFLIDRDEVEQAWSIKDLLYDQKENFECGTNGGNPELAR